MTEQEQRACQIAEALRKAGMTAAGAAGVLGNIQAESAFKPNNLQDYYNTRFSISDEEYTRQVDTGQRNFIDDAGYGYCQWTMGYRKNLMMEYARKRNTSISDQLMQIDFLIEEMRGTVGTGEYRNCWRTCCVSNDPEECAAAVCKIYERPDQMDQAAVYRSGLARSWYQKLIGQTAPEQQETPEPAADEEPETEEAKEKFWPPRMLGQGMLGTDVMAMQAILTCRGYGCTVDGIFSKGTLEKLMQYQWNTGRLQVDGICGPLTWASLTSLEG